MTATEVIVYNINNDLPSHLSTPEIDDCNRPLQRARYTA
jgi:hypothetical protein